MIETYYIIACAGAALFGAVVGSFLNVCIYRVPLRESIVTPRSFCPSCRKTIPLYDNIPILSYLLLRGACRSCGSRISPVYPVIEVATALISLLLFHKYGLSWKYGISFIFVSALLVVTVIDIRYQIIPDAISIPGIPLAVLASAAVMGRPWLDALLGALIGGGLLFLVAAGYWLFTRREGMGGGDIKLLAMIGGFFGWQSLFFIVLASSVAGALVGLAIILMKKGSLKYAVPFGPFLSLAAFLNFFVGDVFERLLFFHQGNPW